jgi:hypothetical protein
MAQNYSTLNQFPQVRTFSGNTANTKVQLPKTAKKLTIYCQTQSMTVAFEGEDSQAPVAHSINLPSGSSIQFNLGRGYNRSNDVYIACGGSADVSLVFEE